MQPEKPYARSGEGLQRSNASPRTVHVFLRALVGGSDHTLADRGTRRLKGVEGDWQLFAVADG